MNLILVSSDEVGPRGEVTLTDRRADHIRTILKGREGQSLRVGMLDGPLGTGMIKTVGPDDVTLRCVFADPIPERPPVDLLLALPRPKVMQRLWASIASLGVGRIMLTNAQKVERCYFDTHVLKPEFYTERLKEGLEQAMDTRLPEVSIHRQLKVLIEENLGKKATDTLRLVSDPGSPRRVADAVRASSHGRILLAVGPEGGWSAYEMDLLRKHGFTEVGIGPRTLRSDTACIALLALVHDALPKPGQD